MLRKVTQLQRCTLRAMDGEIGTVEQLYFDDETWTIRYLVVNTGSWLAGRLVLISPIAVGQTDWEAKQLEVALTKKEVEGSPEINTDKPISRQHEAALWASMSYSAGLPTLGSVAAGASASSADTESADSHLRSTKEVTGYFIEATDGEIGHVENFMVDLHTWTIQYLEVNTRNWWPGKKVLISPRWIERVSWVDANVYVNLSRDAIKNGPEYMDSMPVTREYEHRLWDHYKRAAAFRSAAEQPYRPTVRQD